MGIQIKLKVFNGFFDPAYATDTNAYRVDILYEYCSDKPDKRTQVAVVSFKPGFPPSENEIVVFDVEGKANGDCNLRLGVQNNTVYDIGFSMIGQEQTKDGKIKNQSGNNATTLLAGTSIQFTCPKGQEMKNWVSMGQTLPFRYDCSTDPSMMTRLLSCTGTDETGCAGTLSVAFPLNNYDPDKNRYYFDPFGVVARINAYSDKMFDASPGELDCDKYGKETSVVAGAVRYSLDCGAQDFSDRVSCKDGRDMIFGKYCKHSCKSYDTKDSANQCVFLNNLYAASMCGFSSTKYGNVQCMAPWKDQIGTRCAIGKNITGVRCPGDRCVVNQTESVCDCCSTTGGCYSRYDSMWRDYNGTTWGCSGLTQCTTKDSEFTTVCDRCRTFCANYASGQDSANASAGIATLEIFQDLTNLTASVGTTTLSTTAKWRNDLFHASSLVLPGIFLPRNFAVPLCTVSLFLCVGRVFYNEFYGLVPRETSELASYTYLDGADEIRSYLDQLLSFASKEQKNVRADVPTWNAYLGNVDWWIEDASLCPLPALVPGSTDQLSVPLPYTVFETSVERQEPSERDAFLSRALASLVGDDVSTIVDAEGGGYTATCAVSLWTVDRHQILCWCLDMKSVGGDTTTAPAFLQKPLSDVLPGEVVLYVVLQAVMATWSPMLYAYVKRLSNPELVLRQTLATYMIPQMDGWQAFACPSGTTPQDCFTRFCKYSLVPDKSLITHPGDIQALFVNNTDPACLCLRTSYGPATTPVYDNTAAMCFGAQCTADASTLAALGLPDTTCEKQCSTVDGWIRASEMRDPSQLNTERFKALCNGGGGGGGGGGTGRRRLSVDWFWLVGVLLLFFFASFYGCYVFPPKARTKPKGWTTTSRARHVVFAACMVVGAGLAVFFGLFLYGNPVCNQDTKSTECLSQLTNSRIPLSFCPTKIFCECVQDKDCGGNNLCDRGACRPVDGTMPPLPLPPFPYYDVGLGVLVLIAVSVCMFYLRIPSRTVYWSLSAGVVAVVAAVLVVLMLFA